MGTFNRLHLPDDGCANCHEMVERVLQFKYGDTRMRHYSVGDTLLWGRNDVGFPGLAEVVTSGVCESCRHCGFDDDRLFEIGIVRDRIAWAKPVGNFHDELGLFGELGYRVIAT